MCKSSRVLPAGSVGGKDGIAIENVVGLMRSYANDVAKASSSTCASRRSSRSRSARQTARGRAVAEAYARKRGQSRSFLACFGAPLLPRKVGDNVASILTDPRYRAGVAFEQTGDPGIALFD